MLPWIQLPTATALDGKMLLLLRRGQEFSIRLDDGNELVGISKSRPDLAAAVPRPWWSAAWGVTMGQMGLFDLSDRYASLDATNDPLVEIDALVPWKES